jgi:hypothetical protein
VTPSESNGSRAGRVERIAWLVICAAACLPYLRTVSDYFVQDDFGVVQLLARKPWTTFPRWFTMPWMEDIWGYTPDEIRPFPALSYQITALWGVAAPQGHHLLNIVLHAINGLLVFEIARAAAGLRVASALVAAVAFVLLPVDAESVAWITGRVDSLPAAFYLASFLAYVLWLKAPQGNRLYGWSLIWFFLALFSKQNTITMAAALVSYDVVVARQPLVPVRRWLRHVPFVLMTLGFLGVRYLVLGEVLRESQLTSQRTDDVVAMIGRHLQRIAFGDVGGIPAILAVVAAVTVAVATVMAARAPVPIRSRVWRAAAYFGPIWITLGLAPTIAAGYESPRHAYLAAVGWAMVIGLVFETLWPSPSASSVRRPIWRAAVISVTSIVLVGYAARLHLVVSDWRQRARVSERATRLLEREVANAAPSTLVLISAPVPSWEWSAPFAARPPYTATDLTTRAFIVTPRLLHCCRGVHWERATRDALDGWQREKGSQAVALYINSRGEVRRLASSDPDLMSAIGVLTEIKSGDALDIAITNVLRKLVAGRGDLLETAF